MVNKSRKMRWTRHVARMRDMGNAYKFWSENLKGRGQSVDLDVDDKIILTTDLREIE
jgi:hypothetical protein